MQGLVIIDKNGQESNIPVEEVKRYIAPNATESELWMFLGLARAYNLNPFKREIHFVKYGSGDSAKAQVIIGYEVYLKRAMETGKLEWWNVTIEGKSAADMVAIFKAKRQDWTEPFEWEVHRSEFDKNQSTWKAMPKFMLKKCAISQGLRLLFPEELGGMPYSPEEINGRTSEQINNASVVDVEYEDVPEGQRVEPEEDEKQRVLDTILKKIASFKMTQDLEDWASRQNPEASILKDAILTALESKRKELATAEAKAEEETAAPSEPSEMSFADQLLAKIQEVLEAAGHDSTYIENRMEGLRHQKVDALKTVLATETKRLKNGNAGDKQENA